MTKPLLMSFPHELGEPRSGPPGGWTIKSGAPEASSWILYKSEDGKKWSGRWRCTPGSFDVSYDKWEFCHVLSGACVITPEGKDPVHLKAGDAFVVEPGFKGDWTVLETMEKHYVFVSEVAV